MRFFKGINPKLKGKNDKEVMLWEAFLGFSEIFTALATILALAENQNGDDDVRTAQYVFLYVSIATTWLIYLKDYCALIKARGEKYNSEYKSGDDYSNYRSADYILPLLGIGIGVSFAGVSHTKNDSLGKILRAASPLASSLFAKVGSSVIKEDVKRLEELPKKYDRKKKEESSSEEEVGTTNKLVDDTAKDVLPQQGINKSVKAKSDKDNGIRTENSNEEHKNGSQNDDVNINNATSSAVTMNLSIWNNGNEQLASKSLNKR